MPMKHSSNKVNEAIGYVGLETGLEVAVLALVCVDGF